VLLESTKKGVLIQIRNNFTIVFTSKITCKKMLFLVPPAWLKNYLEAKKILLTVRDSDKSRGANSATRDGDI
jgi:hypothetical protein